MLLVCLSARSDLKAAVMQVLTKKETQTASRPRRSFKIGCQENNPSFLEKGVLSFGQFTFFMGGSFMDFQRWFVAGIVNSIVAMQAVESFENVGLPDHCPESSFIEPFDVGQQFNVQVSGVMPSGIYFPILGATPAV